MVNKPLSLFLSILCAIIGIAGSGYFGWWMLVEMNRIPVFSGLMLEPGYGSLAWDAALVFLFGFLHSFFARANVKGFLRNNIPFISERLIFVFVAGISLFVLSFFWSRNSIAAWQLSNEIMVVILYGIQILGWLIVIWAGYAIDPLGLVGLSPLLELLGIKKEREEKFITPGLYKIVRHPIYLGILLSVWVKPVMSIDGLLFGICMTIYLLIGIYFEERDLLKKFPSEYETYSRRVKKLIPFFY